MEFEEVLFYRRSVRRFDDSGEVLQEQLRKLIQAGILVGCPAEVINSKEQMLYHCGDEGYARMRKRK